MLFRSRPGPQVPILLAELSERARADVRLGGAPRGERQAAGIAPQTGARAGAPCAVEHEERKHERGRAEKPGQAGLTEVDHPFARSGFIDLLGHSTASLPDSALRGPSRSARGR